MYNFVDTTERYPGQNLPSDGAVPTEFVTPDGFDFGTGDTATDLAMVWRRDPSAPLPGKLTATYRK